MSLVTLRPGVSFRDDAAASFARQERARGRQIDVNRSTVSIAAQMVYRTQWLAFSRDPAAWRRANPGKSDPPYALDPKDSEHVYKPATDTGGTAVDSDDPQDALWLEHGWVIVNRSELWHREYRKAQDKHRDEGWPADDQSKPFTQEDEAMDYIKISGKSGSRQGGTYAVFNDGGGKYSAVWIGNGGPELATVTDEAAIAKLQQRISGLGRK